MTTKFVGADVRRVEDPRLITGKGRYVGDIQLPGMLHLALKRSPHPKARILRIDTSRAQSAPGVRLILTGEDTKHLPPMPANRAIPNMKVPDQPVLPVDVVHIVGSPVAAVVATSRQAAEDAVDLIDVEYEVLPSVADVEEAMSEGAPLVHESLGTNVSFQIRRRAGDPDAAFASAAKIASVKVVQPRLAAVPLEPRGVLVDVDPLTGSMTVSVSTQTPNRPRTTIAEMLQIPESHVRSITPDVGGGFGAKSPTYREELICALAAQRLGQPVRWLADRIEDLQTTQQGRDTVAYMDAAIDEECRITAIRLRLISNLGAFVHPAGPAPALLITQMATGAYQVRHFEADVYGVLTDTAPTGPYRGAGRPDAVIIVERLMDEVAHVGGLDPVEARRRNFIRADQMPYKTITGATYDSGDYEATMNVALEAANYAALREEQAEARARGELYGIGITTFVEPSGGGLHESGLVRIEPTGAVTAYTGSSAHGQGHETTFAQILAEKLGVPYEQISVSHGDTSASPPGIGTFGSRSTLTGGSALLIAAERVLEKAKRIAAHQLEAAPDDIEIREGRFVVAGSPDRSVSWAQVAAAAHGRGGAMPPGEDAGLESTVFFRPTDSSWGHGTYIVVVRIDPESGAVTLERLTAVDDCGVVINPLLVEGQVQGGIAQGIGQALLEHVAYDPTGQLLSGSLMDYLVPGFDAIPPMWIGHTESPSPLNPLGAKGVGEAGTIGVTGAILNAVVDALRPLGVSQVDFPFAPHRIWESIAASRVNGDAR